MQAPLQQMDMKSLEEEHKALQADKAGEIEYFQSLEERINEMKVRWCYLVWLPYPYYAADREWWSYFEQWWLADHLLVL